jgi:hypothetical protein
VKGKNKEYGRGRRVIKVDVRLPRSLDRAIEAVAFYSRMSKSRIIAKALREYFGSELTSGGGGVLRGPFKLVEFRPRANRGGED